MVRQEVVADLERTKKELKGSIQRKEKDPYGFFSKLDNEQSLLQRFIKLSRKFNPWLREWKKSL